MAGIEKSTAELKKSKILDKGPKLGDSVVNFSLFNPLKGKKIGEKAFNFSLLNALGEKVELKNLLLKGRLFYLLPWRVVSLL